MEIRKINIFIENLQKEMKQSLDKEHITATIAVTATNPYAGKFTEDLSLLSTWSEEHGEEFVERLLYAAHLTPEEVECFGKAAIIGTSGEIEHAAALLHPTLGTPVRRAVKGSALMSSTNKIGLPGCTIDVPVRNKNAVSMDHSNSIEISVPDAPRADEFVLLLAVTNCSRPFPRKYNNATDLSKLK